MSDTIRVQDHFRQWVLCLTADHGHTASPGRTGGAAIVEPTVHQLLERRFDAESGEPSLVQIVRPAWVNLNPSRAQSAPYDAMSRYLTGLTLSQVASPGMIPSGGGTTRAFDAAFAASLLPGLGCG